jgi:hypothetical protein
MTTQDLFDRIQQELETGEYYKFSTCDAPNWDVSQHAAALALYHAINPFNLDCSINWGVHDWTATKKFKQVK